MIQILLAFIAGILTIAAPCILLPLPIILGGSVGQSSRTRPLFIALGFVASFATVALVINYLVHAFGFDANVLRTVAVIALAVFSLFMIWPTPFEKLMAHMSGFITKAGHAGQQAGNGNFGGFVLGMIIGIVWAPCAGPILGAILTLIGLQENLGRATILLVAYAIGAGVPMLAIAYGGQVLTTRIKSIAKYSTILQQIFGVILLLLAVAIYFQYDTFIQAKLVEKFPVFGTALESKINGSLQPEEEKYEAGDNKFNLAPPQNIIIQTSPAKTELNNYGQAPEFTGIEKWLNSDPLTIKKLKGRVVLIDFWTYSCINCIRTLPYVTKWYDKYKDQGFVVVGVHTPEFAFEKITSNVERAIKQHAINYPVAQDNSFGTWQAYSNQYWPAHYLIDKNGVVRYTHFGEGKYDVTENNIRYLLSLDATVEIKEEAARPIKSPEMYFGTERIKNLTTAQTAYSSEYTYVVPNRLDLNTFALEGNWKFDGEKATLVKGPGKIKLHFGSGKVHMVANGKTQTIKATVDNYPTRLIKIEGSDLYTLFDSEDYNNHVLEIEIPEAGFEAFTFTFG